MSILATITQEASVVLAAAPPLPTQDGVLDWVDDASARTLTTARGVAIAAAVIFVIVVMVSSKMAMTKIIVAGLSAGVFVWIIYNVTDLRDRVDSEVNASSMAVVRTVQLPDEVPVLRHAA